MKPDKLRTQTEGLAKADTLQVIGLPTVVRCPSSLSTAMPQWCVIDASGAHYPFQNERTAREIAARRIQSFYVDCDPCEAYAKIIWETDGPRLTATLGCMVVGTVQQVGDGEWAAQNLIEPDGPRLGYFPLEQAIAAVQDAVARELAVAR